MSGAYPPGTTFPPGQNPWDRVSQGDMNAWAPVMNRPVIAAVPATAAQPSPIAQPKMPTPPTDYGPVNNPMENVAPDGQEDYLSLLKSLRARGDTAASEQRAAADPMRQQLAALQQSDLQLDLSPLAALVDQWSGSNFAKSYKAPETADQRQAKISALQKGIADSGQNASTTEMAGLKALAEGTFGLEKLRSEDKYKQDMLEIQREQNRISNKRYGEYRSDEKIEKDVQKLGAAVGETATLTGKLSAVDSILSKYSSGKDIPGVGANDSWKPDVLVSEDGTNLRQITESIKSDVIRMYSGAAASEKEVRRIASSLGEKMTQSDEQFRFGMRQLADAIAIAQREKEARFRPEVVERYQGRGGVSSKELGGYAFGDQTSSAQSGPDLSSMTDDQLRAIAARGKK